MNVNGSMAASWYSRQRGLVLEQEPGRPRRPVVQVVGHRAGVVGEPDEEHGVRVVPAGEPGVAGVQRAHRLEVVGERLVEHHVLGALLEDGDDLRLQRVRVQQHARHVGLRVLGDDRLLAGGEVDPGEPPGVGPGGADHQQGLPVLAERHDVAGGRVLGGDRQQRAPLVVGGLADEQVEAAVRLRPQRPPHDEVLVGDPAGETGVLDLLHQRAGRQVQPVHVVQLRVVLVDADERLARLALAGADEHRVDALERGQVATRKRLRRQVHVVQPPVLVPADVLDVEQVPAVVRPGAEPDAPVGVLGHRPRRIPVDAVSGDRRDPGVQDAVARRDPGQLRSVRGQARASPLGIAEEHAAGDEFDHGTCLPQCGESHARPSAAWQPEPTTHVSNGSTVPRDGRSRVTCSRSGRRMSRRAQHTAALRGHRRRAAGRSRVHARQPAAGGAGSPEGYPQQVDRGFHLFIQRVDPVIDPSTAMAVSYSSVSLHVGRPVYG